MKRLFANKNKSAFYRKIVETSVVKANETINKEYEHYAKEVFTGIELASGRGAFSYWYDLPGVVDRIALNKLIQELKNQGFDVSCGGSHIDDNHYEETLVIKWRKT